MNEEFNQFPPSNDDDKKSDEQFKEFLSGISDDDESPVIPALSEMPEDTDDQTAPNQMETSDQLEEFPSEVSDSTEPRMDTESPELSESEIADSTEPDEPELEASLIDSSAASSTKEDQSAIDDWLSDHLLQGDYHAILILKDSRAWKRRGELSKADLREIERAVSEAQKGGNAMDMARYVRLGPKQEKFLLYVSTISGSLVLCTINYSRHPLSEIRDQTRAASAQLSIDEEQITFPEMDEVEEEPIPVPIQERGRSDAGEAPQVMVNDLIGQPVEAGNQFDLFTETDGWVFENREIQEDVNDKLLDSTGDSGTDELEKPQPVTQEETSMEGYKSASDEEAAHETVTIPKAGYGRMKISKPAFGKLFHLTEEELSSLASVNISKPSFSGITKTEPAMTSPEFTDRFREQYSGWKPDYTDVMAYKRKRLKNQKPANKSKQWRYTVPLQVEDETMAESIEEESIAPPETLVEGIPPATSLEEIQAVDQIPAPDGQQLSDQQMDQPPTNLQETEREDIIFLDESSDFLKELSQDNALDTIDQDQDASAFFEDYFNRSGEAIEPLESLDKIDEFIPMDETPDTPETNLPLSAEPLEAGETMEEEPAAFPENEVLPKEADSHPEVDIEIEKDEESGVLPPAESLKPVDIDEDYNQMIIAMQERLATAVQVPPPAEPEAQPGVAPRLDADSQASDEELSSRTSLNEDEQPDTPQTEMDLRKIISNALIDADDGTASEKVLPSVSEAASRVVESESLDAILNDDLFPWETEAENADTLEATPTPQSWITADQPGDGLVDMLADSSLDPVHLGFDQPMYTCILVPELGEYSLTNPIAEKIREWLPRLARVFGWQFENILVQPTYLQWTVRVPAGTSQGSIVRKIRQQISLRIFEEFPDLKNLSQDGNFWAKGYLVVAGSNPPPAEFLDDFIQKNRKPLSTGNG